MIAEFIKLVWKNKPDLTTKLNAGNLNRIEDAVEAVVNTHARGDGTDHSAVSALQGVAHSHNNSTALNAVSGTNTGDQDLSGKLNAEANSVDNTLVRWDGTNGTDIQGSGVVISDNDEVSGAGTLINTQVDSYTLELTDAGKTIEMNKATACTLTIPANALVAFKVGTIINIIQIGAGQVSIAINTDTLLSSGSKVKLTGQYSVASLYKRTTTEWVLFGDIAA